MTLVTSNRGRIARIFAMFVLAVTALPLTAGAAGASTEGYTTGTNVMGAQAAWSNGCPTTEGTTTCTGSLLDVAGIDSHGSAGDAPMQQRVCFDTGTESYPAGDVSAMGGGVGTSVYERGCTTVGRDKLQIDGLSSVTLSPVTIPLSLCVRDEYQDCHWEYSRDVTVSAGFRAITPTTRGWWYHSRDGWYPDGCLQVDGSVSQFREALVYDVIDGQALPGREMIGASIQHRTSNYTETCR